MKRKLLISIFIPCYNEEENVELAYKTLIKTISPFKKYDFELIFVDNGSIDSTRQEIKKIIKKDIKVKGIFLSRNFGPEASGEAGMDFSNGDALIGFSCDLQDPASLIPIFINKWEEGYDNVIGVYTKTSDNFFIFWLRKQYYKILKSVAYIDLPLNSNGYGLMSRKVIDATKKLQERYRIFRGIRVWVGFKTLYVPYERNKRLFGKSSYSLYNYFQFTLKSFFGLSYFPLDIFTYLGFFLVVISFIAIIMYLSYTLLFGNPLKSSIAIFVSIIFFGGLNMLGFSVIGKYIQIIVEETKHRPLYIVDTIITRSSLKSDRR